MVSAVRLALGTAQWGLDYGATNRTGRATEAEVATLLATAQAAGIDTLDTARAYGVAEQVIGRLAPNAPWRVVTKLAPDVAGDDIPPGEARERTATSLERSRRALRRDRLDAVLLHRDAHRTASGGASWAALREELAAGRIGAIGVSIVDVNDANDFLAAPDVGAIQVPASLLDQRLRRDGFFARAADAGREVFVRSVFLQGVAHLPANDLPSRLVALEPLFHHLDSVAADLETTRGALFLTWARDSLPGARIVIGCETAAQLKANLAVWHRPVPPERLRELDACVPELPAAVLDPWRWPKNALTRRRPGS